MTPRGSTRAEVLAAILASPLFLTSAPGAGARAVGGEATCGPARAKSLYVQGPVRIFLAGSTGHASFVCDGTGPAVKMSGRAVLAPFAVGGTWAAGVTEHGEGVDTAYVGVVAADTRSHARIACRVGGANRPGQLPRVQRLWAGADGRVAISAQAPLKGGPYLALCSKDGLRTLASGPELDLGSVEEKGHTLRWSEGGQPRSVRL